MSASRVDQSLARRVTELVASSLDETAIVMGSLPPNGRDLDLLVRRAARERLAATFADAGLADRGGTFAIFDACSAYSVELIEGERYLPTEPLEALFAAARPLPGLAPLAAPAPAHALLILARLLESERSLPEKRRARLDRAVAEDPQAWEAARQQAQSWKAVRALDSLSSLAQGTSVQRRLPARMVHGARAVRARGRRNGPILVSLSGLDGSGKSSQARWLTEALTALGVEVEMIWNDLLGNFTLDLMGRPAKTLLRISGRATTRMANEDPASPSSDQGPGLARQLWGAYVTSSNSLEQRLLAARAKLRNRVVVFDRGPLDLAVRMDFLYRGWPERQRRMVELLAPRPDLAFFLDIPAELSLERKDDYWSLAQLQDHAERYRALAGRFGARRLDGTRAPEEIAAEIAESTWRRL
jgi:thymidylate kinase